MSFACVCGKLLEFDKDKSDVAVASAEKLPAVIGIDRGGAQYLLGNGPQIDHRNPVNGCERTSLNVTKNCGFI